MHVCSPSNDLNVATLKPVQMSTPPTSTPAPSNPKGIILDCSHTRYHVVRAAGKMIGWVVSDAGTEETVPASFYDVSLTGDRDEALAHPPQVIWTDKSVLVARVSELQCYQRLNHFPSMHYIARKAVLFRRLMQLSRLVLKPASAASETGLAGSSSCSASPLHGYFADSIPPSFSSAGDLSRLATYLQLLSSGVESTTPPFFIIKPNRGCEGRGIRLTTSPLDDLTEAERTDKRHECIVQLYIDRPLLMDGKKFDLRLYVLLVSVTPTQRPRQSIRSVHPPCESEAVLHAESTKSRRDANLTEVPPGVEGVRLYVHREGLVRICAKPYEAPTAANCTDPLRHLTNYAVNKKSTLFKPAHTRAEKDDGDNEGSGGGATRAAHTPVEEGNKRSFAALAAYVDELGVPGGWAAVQRRIDACIVLTVLSGVEALRREMVSAGGARGERADGRGCFELLGFDVMLHAATLAPVLMEVNHSPSLFCDTAFDFAVKSAVLHDTFRLLETHLPPWADFEGNAQLYAAYTAPGSGTAAAMEQSEASLRLDAGTPSGFRSLLPHYTAAVGTDVQEDWQHDERAAQELMARMSKQLR